MRVEYKNGDDNVMYFLVGDDLQIVGSNEWELCYEDNGSVTFVFDGKKYRYEKNVFPTKEAAKRMREYEFSLDNLFVFNCEYCGAVLALDISQDKIVYDGGCWVTECPVCRRLATGTEFLKIQMECEDDKPQWLKDLVRE